jgi:hypothetical protein
MRDIAHSLKSVQLLEWSGQEFYRSLRKSIAPSRLMVKKRPRPAFTPPPPKRIPHAPEQRGGTRFCKPRGSDSSPALLAADLLRRVNGCGGAAPVFRLALILQRENRDQGKSPAMPPRIR